MAYHENYHRHRHAAGIPTLLMMTAMLAAATSGALVTRKPPAPAVLHAEATPSVERDHSWTHQEIVELITAIEQSKRHGLDPSDYGLAALRSEMEQESLLWGSGRSHQLDVLAWTSAMALANGYRAHSGQAPVSPGDLDAALNEGDLQGWFAALSSTPSKDS